MTAPLSRSLSPRAWAFVVWLSAIFVNVNVSGLVITVEHHLLLARGVSSQVLMDLERSPLATEPVWLIVNASAVQLSLLLCALLWLWLLGSEGALPFKSVSPAAWVGTFLLSLGALPIGSAAEELTRQALGLELTTGLVIAKLAHQSSAWELVALLLSVAVLPGLAEEALFRGVITRQLSRYSKLEALLVPSLLFALAHLEPAQVAGTFFLGLAFGYARNTTGSILPAMAAHVVNNALVLTLAFSSDVDPTQQTSIEWALVGVAGIFSTAGVLLLRRASPTS